jgi:hypothetical protein
MSFITKNWVNGDYTISSELNRMETGISSAVTHSTSTENIHGIVNPAGTTETQTLTGKSMSSSTGYTSRTIKNFIYSTSTGTSAYAGDLLLLYTP